MLDNQVFKVSLNGNGGTTTSATAKNHLKSKLKQNIGDGDNPFIVTGGPNSPKVLPIEMIGNN